MQQFKSIKKIQLTIVNLILIGSVSADSIGSIVEQSGSAQITRQKQEISRKLNGWFTKTQIRESSKRDARAQAKVAKNALQERRKTKRFSGAIP